MQKGRLGILCVTLVWILASFVYFSVSYFLASNNGVLNGVLFLSVMLMCWSHLAATSSSPGYTRKQGGKAKFEKLVAAELALLENCKTKPTNNLSHDDCSSGSGAKFSRKQRQKIIAKLRQEKRYCKLCENFKPKSTHHCSTCRRCVYKMDHHCPWINNCVGGKNLKKFLLFVSYTMLSCTIVIGILVYNFVEYLKGRSQKFKNSAGIVDTTAILCCSLSFLLSVIFLAFGVSLIMEQHEALITGIPGIDALQGARIKEFRGLSEALHADVLENTAFTLRWFLPIRNSIKRHSPKPSRAPTKRLSDKKKKHPSRLKQN